MSAELRNLNGDKSHSKSSRGQARAQVPRGSLAGTNLTPGGSLNGPLKFPLPLLLMRELKVREA